MDDVADRACRSQMCGWSAVLLAVGASLTCAAVPVSTRYATDDDYACQNAAINTLFMTMVGTASIACGMFCMNSALRRQ